MYDIPAHHCSNDARMLSMKSTFGFKLHTAVFAHSHDVRPVVKYTRPMSHASCHVEYIIPVTSTSTIFPTARPGIFRSLSVCDHEQPSIDVGTMSDTSNSCRKVKYIVALANTRLLLDHRRELWSDIEPTTVFARCSKKTTQL